MKKKGSILRARVKQFVIDISIITKAFPTDYYHRTLTEQLLRSATSAYLNFGEADCAASRRDFIHKLRLCSKEIRESHHNLDLLCASSPSQHSSRLKELLKEADEIGAMLYASIRTASKNPP